MFISGMSEHLNSLFSILPTTERAAVLIAALRCPALILSKNIRVVKGFTIMHEASSSVTSLLTGMQYWVFTEILSLSDTVDVGVNVA